MQQSDELLLARVNLHQPGVVMNTNSTVERDSDFNLSQTAEDAGGEVRAMNNPTNVTGDLSKGEALYSECKNAFFDLQRHKNDNNAEVADMLRAMERLIESSTVSRPSDPILGDLSSMTPKARGTGFNESSFIEPGPYYYSPHNSATIEEIK